LYKIENNPAISHNPKEYPPGFFCKIVKYTSGKYPTTRKLDAIIDK
jgi:hypothetical protein